jgi:hypothetical protein
MKNFLFEKINRLIAKDFWRLKFDHIFISPCELQKFFAFQFFCPKNIFFQSFKWGIIFMDFVGFPFKTSKF